MKVKNKNKNLSDSLRKKKTLQKKVLNPFEVHINRQKFQVLERNRKYDHGLPGVARAKSIKKRKETLLQEYKVKDKANKFVDRRIGENNAAMTAEDKLTVRFAAERVRVRPNRKTIFNLADDGILTHRGQTVNEIEKFDDPRSDDDDEDDEFSHNSGRLDAQFVEDAHFGGGMLKKSDNGQKSRTTLIEELIAESKKRKAERQHAKEKTLKLTEKLDADWKDLLPLAFGGSKKNEEDTEPQKESYDIVMRELKFEARGIPSDKLKSEDEIAKEEKEKLEKLEKDRLERMKGIDKSEKKVVNHRSADDLDDGFDMTDDLDDNADIMNEGDKNHEEESSSEDESEEDDEVMEATSEMKEDIPNSENLKKNVDSKQKEISEKDYDVEEESNAHSDDINEDDDNDSDDDNGNEDDDNSNDDEDDNDSLSDMKGEFFEEGSEETEDENNKESLKRQINLDENINKIKPDITEREINLNKNKFEIHKEGDDIKINDSNHNQYKIDVNKFKIELLEKKKLMEQARKELPYTFSVPENYEDLQEMFSEKSAETRSVIIERMIKCNHPTLGKNNKENLNKLLIFLFQALNDAKNNDCWRLLDRLSPHLYDLTQFSPNEAANYMSEVLKEKHADFKACQRIYPFSDTLIFLQLIAVLFPTSDARHQITTPAMVFLCQILFYCKVLTTRDVASGLLVATIISQYVSISKRFCVEAINFLRGCLSMALPLDVQTETIPPFKPSHRLLLLSQPQNILEDSENDLRMRFSDLTPNNICDDIFCLRAINTVVLLLTEFAKYYEPLSASQVIFKPCLKILQQLPVDRYPETIKQNIETLQDILDKMCKKKLQYVMLEKKKPKPLKMYEPDIQKVYDGKRYRDLPEDKLEQQKLVQKCKKEMKGALREVRRDKSFLAKIKFRNQAKSDEERMRRVKQIYSWGANQEGELRKLKRKKS